MNINNIVHSFQCFTFQGHLSFRNLLVCLLVTVVRSLLINEVNFSHNHPFIEIAKEPLKEHDISVPNGHYGVIVFHYSVLRWDKQVKGRPRLRVRVAFDLTGYDFSQNFVVLGNVPNLQPNGRIKIKTKGYENWLQPPDKSYVFVVLTYHDTVGLLDEQNWTNLNLGRFTALAGNLHKYTKDNAYDMVYIESKNKASQHDKAEMYEEILALFEYKENNMGHIKSTEDELEPKSQNRCDFYSERFSPKSFKIGTPSPNNQNDCGYQNQAEVLNNEEDKEKNSCDKNDCNSAIEGSFEQSQPRKSVILRESMKALEEWSSPSKTDWEHVAFLVRTNQKELINWKLFLKPEYQAFLQYLIDPKDPKKSRFK